MVNNNSYACAEVLDVLDNMEPLYVEKIPQSFIKFLKENASSDYQNHITLNKPLEDQNLNSKTLSILAVINLKYWVESEEHKQELINQYRENGFKKVGNLNESFDYNDIFDNSKSEKLNIDAEDNKLKEVNNLPVERKSIFRKIIDFFYNKIFE